MNEEFLHYLWKFRLLGSDLQTDTGDSITIIHPGIHNHDSGPDFFNARIRFGGTVWAGNVEIHVLASDWFRHNHQQDRAYDNVILHAVYENDVLVNDVNGNRIPTLSLKGKFTESVFDRYRDIQKNHRWIPCEQLISGINPFVFTHWAAALSLEFQAGKTERFYHTLDHCRNDWDECFYRQLSRAFGFRINALPFEQLAGSVPVKLVRKYNSQLEFLEALLFGQAGLLSADFSEDFPRVLLREYNFLRNKHHLEPMNAAAWKFLRLRPSNFPTIRIAQFAALMHREDDIFAGVMECNSLNKVRDLFGVKASGYWTTHFMFGKISPGREKILGAASVDLLISNLVVPFLLFYGNVKKNDGLKERGLTFLEALNGESNSDISNWVRLGLPAENALHTQALLALKRNYCELKRCLDCRIGNVLLNNKQK